MGDVSAEPEDPSVGIDTGDSIGNNLNQGNEGDNRQAQLEQRPLPSDAFYSQYSSIPIVHSERESSQTLQGHGQSTFGSVPSQPQSAMAYNMGAMATALPDQTILPQMRSLPPPQAQRATQGPHPHPIMFQYQQYPSYQSQGPSRYHGVSAFGPAYSHGAFSQPYAAPPVPAPALYQLPSHNSQLRQQGNNPFYQNIAAQPQPYFLWPYVQQGQFSASNSPQAFQQPELGPRRSSLPMAGLPSGVPFNDGSMFARSIPVDEFGQPSRIDSQALGVAGMRSRQQDLPERAPPYSAPPATPALRGPPRKPKQSGHALWVGNLPPGTTVMELKDHFSRDATKDIESLFLISKSNCAFVNYRTEASCAAAMQRFHDSRLNNVRLVCRLRRSSTQPPAVTSGPSTTLATRDSSTSPNPKLETSEADGTAVNAQVPRIEIQREESESKDAPRVHEKFFVVKSLTLQDLEASVRNGIWATQAHNESTFNRAYDTADNVYLIFSANKSGEYFGYARMASRILEDASDIMTTVPKVDTTATSSDAPRSIPTPPTEFAPKGRIIDDSARGTIFWEAEHSDDEAVEEDMANEEKERSSPDVEQPSSQEQGNQSWGKPFRVEWISTQRLPFYRTRGLRNPWNANREVKIARDGTELETSVGRRLVQMFQRAGTPSAAPSAAPLVQLPGQQPRPY